MEQGIIIGFFANPTTGDFIHSKATIEGVPILFINGLDSIDFEFTNSDSEVALNPLHRVKIGLNVEETANNVYNFLNNNNYTSSSISTYYKLELKGNWQVKGYFTSDKIILFDIDSTLEGNAVINSFNFTPQPVSAPKYFFEFENVAGNIYRCEIYQKNFTGQTKEINGRVVMTKTEVDNHLEPIKGSGLDISLEASDSLNFTDLYSQNEQDFKVRLYVGLVLLYEGFLIPDGITQSFTSNVWDINLKSVDGLGFLENLSFVKKNGFPFSGKMSILDIIYNCLQRTGLQLMINTFVDLYHEDLIIDQNTDHLSNSYIDVERFVKDDNSTFMSCKEVLENILKTFGAVLAQKDAQWYIYRPSDMYLQNMPRFKRYDLNNKLKGVIQLNIKRDIGSHIDNFSLHHCNKNQIIETKGAISSFRIGYKYGYIKSLLDNGKLNHEANTLNYPDWYVFDFIATPYTGAIIINPDSTQGITFKSALQETDIYITKEALRSTKNLILEKGQSFEFRTRVVSYGYPVYTDFIVKCGDFTLSNDGKWRNPTQYTNYLSLLNADDLPEPIGVLNNLTYDRSFSVKSEGVPESGTLIITLYVPKMTLSAYESAISEVKYIEVINTFAGNNIVGEFHTVSRINNPNSIVKTNKETIIGDNINAVFSGAIFRQDKQTLTKQWSRGYYPSPTRNEIKPLLQIAAEDELRLNQKTNKKFTGDVYGYVDYITINKINNIEGIFMPIAWEYDCFKNITSLKQLELYSPEVYDILYLKTDDYGTTVKPTII